MNNLPASPTAGIILPVYNEEQVLPLFHGALLESLEGRTETFRFIYINDGSRDASLDILTELAAEDDRVVVLNLAKNSGHQIAITAGLDYCAKEKFDVVGIMDTDLQDPPSVLLSMVDVWASGEADVIYAQRTTRKDTFFKKHSASIFYKTLNLMSEVEIPQNVGDFRVMDRKVVDEVVKHREHDRFMRGIIASVGFRQQAFKFERASRAAGETHYPLKKMLELAYSGIFGFSTLPLKWISRVGWSVSVVSLFASVYFIFLRIFMPEIVVPGWSFIVVGMFFFGGVQLVFLGIIGEYLRRIYTEVLNRPLYSLASKIEAGEEE